MSQSDLKVNFLGPPFTFSHEAALKLFPKAQFFDNPDPKTIFKKVESGEMDYGLLPVENSATGLIVEFYHLLLNQDFKQGSTEVPVHIVKELYLPIYHHLLTRLHLPVAEIQTLYTHRQPYLQCADWVSTNLQNVRIEFTESTAAAADKLGQDPNGACIGGGLLAKERKLIKMRENIHDFAKNVTRFFAITSTHTRTPAHSDKTTFSIIIPDRVGMLVNVLQLIASRHINLLNIKTLPVRAANIFHEDFKDWFIVDVATSESSTEFQSLLDQFNEQRDLVLSYKVLGSYAGASQAHSAKRKARNAANRAKDDKQETYDEMIKKGESETVEFKSTLRYDLRTKQVNKELTKVIAKTLAGFMNTHAGYLFIGISDDGEAVGIENDIQILTKKSKDGFLSALHQVVENFLGKEFSQFLHIEFYDVSGKTVCCVKVVVSTKAAWLADAGTHTLFIRVGNSTRPLDPKDANDYILSRFR